MNITIRSWRLLQLAAIALVLMLVAIATTASADSPTPQKPVPPQTPHGAYPMLDQAIAKIDTMKASGQGVEGRWDVNGPAKRVQPTPANIVPIDPTEVDWDVVVPGQALTKAKYDWDTMVLTYNGTSVSSPGFLVQQRPSCLQMVPFPADIAAPGQGIAIKRMEGIVAVVYFTPTASSIWMVPSCHTLARGAVLTAYYADEYPEHFVGKSQSMNFLTEVFPIP